MANEPRSRPPERKRVRQLEIRELEERRLAEEKQEELERTHHKCGFCGGYVPREMNFCTRCGKRVGELDNKTCPSCKCHTPVSLLFCVKCGERFPDSLIEEELSAPFVKRGCPRCGGVLNTGDNFCEHCGTESSSKDQKELDGLLRCPSCNKYVGDDLRFCIFCGEPLKGWKNVGS